MWLFATSPLSRGGLLLDLMAGARGLKESRAQALFHDQHRVDAEEGLPVGFLRVGIEYPDGRQASNLAGHHGFWGTDSEPEGPVLFQGGGGEVLPAPDG